jgi:hypothetical protein
MIVIINSDAAGTKVTKVEVSEYVLRHSTCEGGKENRRNPHIHCMSVAVFKLVVHDSFMFIHASVS